MSMQNTPAMPNGAGAQRAMNESIQALSALIGQLQRRERALDESILHQLQQLQSAVDTADRRVNHVVEDSLPRLTQLSRQALSGALDPATQQFKRTLAATDEQLQQTSHRYAQAQQSLESTVMRRMWMGSIAMAVAALIGLGSVAYALQGARGTLAEAEQRRAEIEFLDRVARANLAPCGEGRLCAELESKAQRYGERRQYRVISLREPNTR